MAIWKNAPDTLTTTTTFLMFYEVQWHKISQKQNQNQGKMEQNGNKIFKNLNETKGEPWIQSSCPSSIKVTEKVLNMKDVKEYLSLS